MKLIASALLALALIAGPAFAGTTNLALNFTGGAAPANTIRLTNQSGAPIVNYPFQFARPFVAGSIPNSPQVLVNGTLVTTQADIKNRYPDGSVAFAVIAVVIPSLPTTGQTVLTFQDAGPPPMTAIRLSQHTALLGAYPTNVPLATADMLDPSYGFDAVLSVTGTAAGAVPQTVSARAMLTAGSYTLWTSGQVAQTIMLADDTGVDSTGKPTRLYDIGFGDGYHPLRPRFYATFWPATRQVQVRLVAENMLTSEIEDIAYTATISAGQASPTVIYTADLTGTQATHAKKHWAMTAWTQRFWLGGTPPAQVSIDYGLAYLASTRFIPNYDATFNVPATNAINFYNGQWAGKPHGIYDGAWNGGALGSGMGIAGARPDIGPYPDWLALWLYTGDWHAQVMSLGFADLAGAFPGHLRESVPGKRLSRADPPGTSTGLGRTISTTDRQTIDLQIPTYAGTMPNDKVNIVGPMANSAVTGWDFEGAHQPSYFFIPYVLTGDPWYLNEMYLWAGFSAGRYNGAAITSNAGRGGSGALQGIRDQGQRGAAWPFRNRVETAFIAPDGDPEKAYLQYGVNDALAEWEGQLKIVGTIFDGTDPKTWGQRYGNYYSMACSLPNFGLNGLPPPLNHWEMAGCPADGTDASIKVATSGHQYKPGAVGTFASSWTGWYLDYALGRAVEVGFYQAKAVQANHIRFILDMINHSGVPIMVGIYQFPVASPCIAAPTSPATCTAGTSKFFDWPGLVGALDPAFVTGVGWNPAWGVALPQYFSDARKADGRPFWAQPGLAMANDIGNFEAALAYGWFELNVRNFVPPADLAANPKWLIVPRTDGNTLPPQPTSIPSTANAT